MWQKLFKNRDRRVKGQEIWGGDDGVREAAYVFLALQPGNNLRSVRRRILNTEQKHWGR